MNNTEKHEMRLEKTHTSGAEEWYCPECGRRFLMQWPPAYKKIVLEPGDDYALHVGGKGGLGVDSMTGSKEQPDAPTGHYTSTGPTASEYTSDAPAPAALEEWREWLKGSGLDKLI
jgi:hypothetical protein